MNEFQSLYIASLLHDIGKFIERAKDKQAQEECLKYIRNQEASKNYAHRRYSAWFVDKFANKKEFLNSNAIRTLVLWHHHGDDQTKDDYDSINKKGILLKLLRIADDLASSERRENKQLDPVEYYKAKIHSPFQDIIFEDEKCKRTLDKNYYLDTSPLTFDKKCGFPNDRADSVKEAYPDLVKGFLAEFENIENEDSLLFLMEKYLGNVPAQTPTEFNGKEHLFKPDINLFDHSRSVAAIAVCLYSEYLHGSWSGKDDLILTNEYAKQPLEAPIILINGNLSGIQDFIFDVKSKNAAQKLKAKSFFVQLLTDVIVKYLIEKLELKQANILYNGGGNFFILAPAYKEKLLSEYIKQITIVLKNLNLYLAFGVVKVGLNNFTDFSKVFSSVTEVCKIDKLLKFRQLAHSDLFEPMAQKLKEDEQYISLTEELVRTTNYLIRNVLVNNKHASYQEPFIHLGKTIDFYFQKEGISNEAILFNNTDFAKNYKGFRFAVKDLPIWNKNNIDKFVNENEKHDKKFDTLTDENRIYDGAIISFERMSQMAYFDTGTQKLGVLKMDVDNLGRIFSEGLPVSLRSISRIASISRSIKWFFEGYMNTLLQLPKFRDKLYVVFSGGDDFFLVGAWNSIFDFALTVRNDFNEFVCYHPAITLSAALLVIDDKYPVSRFAQIAEERLHDAKYKSPTKNSVNVFDTVISWDDFIEAQKLKNQLVDLIKNYDVNRAVLEKIRKSSRGFEKIQNDALKGNVKLMKVWRLAYYLREIINSKKKDEKIESIKKIVEAIVKQYENLVFEALKGNSTSIKIFPIAARWAELETRN